MSYTATRGGISVNVWYYIGPFGKGPLFLAENEKWYDSDGNRTQNTGKPEGFDGKSYENMLERAIPMIKQQIGNQDCILFQDNASIHCRTLDEDKNLAKGIPKRTYVKELYKKHGITYEPWPAKSPDMNVIENCHTLLESSKRERLMKLKKRFFPKNKSELFSLLKQSWDDVENEKVLNIYNSFVKRLRMIKAIGGKNNLPL